MNRKKAANPRERSLVLQGRRFTAVALPRNVVDAAIRLRNDSLNLVESLEIDGGQSQDALISPVLEFPSIEKGKTVKVRVKDVIAVREYDGGKSYGGESEALRFPTRGE